jgi:hypothetical protein
MEREIDTGDSLDRLFDDFNRRMSEQIGDILSRIDTINSGLKEALAE